MVNLPKQMENPYQILKRFIKWEIMDHEAIMETIDLRLFMKKKIDLTEKHLSKAQTEMEKLQGGKTSIFQSKKGAINKITDLNS